MTQLWLSLAVVLWLLLQFAVPAAVVLVAERHGKGMRVAVPLLAVFVALALWRGHAEAALTVGGAAVAAAVVWRLLCRGARLWCVALAGLAPLVLANGLQFLASDPASIWADLERGAQTLMTPSLPDSATGPEAKALAEDYRELAGRATTWTLRLLPGGVLVFLLGEVLGVVALAGRLGRGAGVFAADVPPFSRWVIPFGSVWLLALGLGLVATRQAAGVVVGLNIVLVSTAVLAIQGMAVIVSSLDRRLPPPVRWPLLVLAVLTAWPFLLVTAALLGTADLWVDFRRLGPTAEAQRS